jgi:large subunit ribosomal protein L18
MNRLAVKNARRARRRIRVRKRILGVPARPRLSVFRSLTHIYAQVIDDLSGRTLAAASSRDRGFEASADGGKVAQAEAVGRLVASRAIAAGVEAIAFDRNGFRYHGRVKALADAAREGGLKF